MHMGGHVYRWSKVNIMGLLTSNMCIGDRARIQEVNRRSYMYRECIVVDAICGL